MKKTFQGEKGFSLIEVISVMVVIGIVGAVVLSRGPTTDIFDLKTQTEIVKGHLRYAQAKSMNNDSIWGIRCFGGNYWLYKDGNFNTKVILPGEDSTDLNLAARKISMPVFAVSYDSWGIPYTDQAATTVQTGGPRTIVVSSTGSAPNQTISITDNTGFVK